MKGQVASIDLILSTLALTLLAFTLVSLIDSEIKNSESVALDEKRDAIALAAVQQLALTPGRPENWDNSSCERIGISCGEGKICDEKISRLASMYSSEYNRTKKLLGLGPYETSVLICNSSSYEQCYYNFSTPARETSRLGSIHVSRAEAISTLGGNVVSVIVYAWEQG